MNAPMPYTLWVSHSSISDFLSCPRAYYLKQVYKDPKTKRKINIITPPIALGSVVHETLESLVMPVEDRFKESFLSIYNRMWKRVTGKLGGFTSETEEAEYKQRGAVMIQRVNDHPGPLLHKALKLHGKDPDFVPNFLLSQKDNVVLCGRIDWMEYVPEDDSVHIIDFKTGKNDEKAGSLQLPIYCLLVKNLQGRKIHKISYWYLAKNNEPTEVPMPNLEEETEDILEIARRMRMVRDSGKFTCPREGCFACKPYEAIIRGEATLVGKNDYQDIYVVDQNIM